MSLSECRVEAIIAVSDMETAKAFYENKLGLSSGEDAGDGGRTYDCGGGTRIHVYPSPGNAGKSGATQAGWQVDDVETTVDELAQNGVIFEQYGDPFNTDSKGIAEMGESKTACFKDPDGNILAIGN